MTTNLDVRSSDEQRTPWALLDQREWLRVTLPSIGDAVVTADGNGNVSSLNVSAQSLTGWTQAAAAGVPLDADFHIINEGSRPPVEDPATRALREGTIVGLANHSLLIARDGTERPVEDSAAPIRNEAGEIVGIGHDHAVQRIGRILQVRSHDPRLPALTYKDESGKERIAPFQGSGTCKREGDRLTVRPTQGNTQGLKAEPPTFLWADSSKRPVRHPFPIAPACCRQAEVVDVP